MIKQQLGKAHCSINIRSEGSRLQSWMEQDHPQCSQPSNQGNPKKTGQAFWALQR